MIKCSHLEKPSWVCPGPQQVTYYFEGATDAEFFDIGPCICKTCGAVFAGTFEWDSYNDCWRYIGPFAPPVS